MILSYYLRRWKNAGLISEEQADAILRFEEKGPSFALYGFSALGGFTILTGIISLIAYNWDNIPGLVKLLIGFLLLGTAGAAAWHYNGKKIVSELLYLLYFGLIIAMIGLAGQVFHLSGPAYGTLFLWTLPSLPFVVVSGSRLTVYVWNAAFFLAWPDFIQNLTGLDFPESLLITLVFLFNFFIWLYILLKFFAEKKIESAGVFTDSLLSWIFTAAAGATVMFAFFNAPGTKEPLGHWIRNPAALLSAVSAAGIVIIFYKYFLKDAVSSVLIGVLLLLYNAYFYLTVSGFLGEFTDAIFFAALWGITAVFAARIRNIRLFDLAVIGSGLRILVIYFQVFENMAYTGFGLIFTGILILAAAFGWYRIHNAVTGAAGDFHEK